MSLSTLREPFKLALSMTLFYWLALWMNWDMPKYGGLAIVLVSLGTAGASMQKGFLRIVGTTVGLAVGMLGLALFAQDRWANLLFLFSYLVIVGYFLQTSRYAYAWYVAGFLPPLVWSTTYGDVANAFHYASFRYLETSAGILIYTVVSLLLWPRHAGDDLERQGDDLWPGLRQLFGLYRRQLDGGTLPAETSALVSKLTGVVTKMLATLQAAYADTPSVMARRREWESLRVGTRAMGDAMELWRESIDDCRRLDLAHLLPGLGEALDGVDRRLARVDDLWRALWADEDSPRADSGDEALLEPLGPRLNRSAMGDLSHFDRAALLGFAQQLHLLDRASGTLLSSVRALVGLETDEAADTHALPPDLYRPSRWDPQRLLGALFPALCFVAAYLFWIIFDPPTGPSVPNMAATFGLLILMTPMNAMKLLPVLLVTMCVAVAPVYFFVMPRLDNGFGLLGLIFGYTFLFGLLGHRSPPLKTVGLMLFVMMTGISNQQSYSFIGLVDGAMMFLLALTIIAIVQMLMSPLRPEHALLEGVRRFFRGCALITAELGHRRPDESAAGRALRRRYYDSMVLPAPQRLQAVAKKLDYGLFPEHGPEQVQGLLESLQSIATRLQALELAHFRVAGRSVAWSEPLAGIGREVRERAQGVFERWSRLEPFETVDERAAMRDLARGLQEQLDETLSGPHSERLDDRTLAELYAVLGCARGLLRAVSETQKVASRMDWDRLAEARF